MERLDPHVRWLIAAPIYAAAYAIATVVFWFMAKRRGVATRDTMCIMMSGLVGGLAGANIIQVLATGLPGKTIEGGIIGGWLAVIWMKRRLHIVRPTGDLFALAIPAGEMVGRIACFIGGCCSGKIARVPWAVYDHAAWRHPAQLYLSLAAAIAFVALLLIERRRILPENGLFYLGGILFCIDRFIVEFFRDGTVTAAGITLAQWACVAGATFFAWKLLKLLEPPPRSQLALSMQRPA